MTAAVVVQSVLLTILAGLVVGLLRSHARILLALEHLGHDLERGARDDGRFSASGARRSADGPAAIPAATSAGVGTRHTDQVHDLMGTTPQGDAAAVAVDGVPQLTLLLFLSSGCTGCGQFWDALRDPSRRLVAGRSSHLVVVARDEAGDGRAAIAERSPADVNVLLSDDAFERYSVEQVPHFVLVDGLESRVVGAGPVDSFDALSSEVSTALAHGGFRPGGQRSRRELLRGLRNARATGSPPQT